MTGKLVPHGPAVLLLLFAGWSGTFAAGAQGWWALLGHLALLAFVGTWGRIWPDPLRLGPAGNLLLLAFGVTAVASLASSPVARAGWLGVLLLPAFLLVPSAVAACWRTAEDRRAGLCSIALGVAIVAGWALVEQWRLATPGASLPLGHHNLLAAWLLTLVPLAAVPWRDGRAGKLLASCAVGLSLVALVSTRSLGAAVAVAGVAAMAASRHRLGRRALVVAGVLLLPLVPRVLRVIGGGDVSTSARWSYLEAGWRGLARRPISGWGPGSASWTVGEHLRPVPGVHPPDQVVADFHCWPLELAYELGGVGVVLALGLVLVFLLRPVVEVVDPTLRRASLTALAALALMSFTGLRMAVTALPLAALVAVGGVLSSETPSSRPPERGRRPAVATALAVLALATGVLPIDVAHLAYDRALSAEEASRARQELRVAAELDPAFPLYRARLAWADADVAPGDPEAARRALEAARAAGGLAPLWLAAGILGQEAEEPWSREALLRACELSPLGAIAPYRLALSTAPRRRRAAWLARALLAEPRILASVALGDERSLMLQAIELAGRVPGIEAGWPEALEAQYLGLDLGGPARQLALGMDGTASTSISLHAFRRWPWPAHLARIDVAAVGLEELDLAPAARLTSTDPAVFATPGCGLELLADR